MNPDAKEIAPASLAGMLERSQIDQQIATAHEFPRSIQRFEQELREMATLNADVAAAMFYSIPRGKKPDGTQDFIEGPTIRFAESAQSAWGNMRTAARMIDEQQKFVVAQGIAFDLQKNSAVAMEVRRRIVKSDGKTRYSEDVIQQTANAAASIALRNAVLRVVPGGLWRPIYEAAREASIPGGTTIAAKRLACLGYFDSLGAKAEDVFRAVGVQGESDLSLDLLIRLRGIATAIKDGETTLEDALRPPEERKRTQRVRKGSLGA